MNGIIETYTCLQGEGKYVGIPHILIRMTGCPMRCAFGDSLCDSPFTSWVPEKGNFTEDQIYEIYANNSQITHTMITGGEPFFNIPLLERIIEIGKKFNQYITIETAGIKYSKTQADFISLSPKLKSSIPKEKRYWVGDHKIDITPPLIERHEKLRRNTGEMLKLIYHHPDFQLKPVIMNIDQDMKEVEELIDVLSINKNKVYLMPAGSLNSELNKIRIPLMEYCQKEGYNYTDRLHIVAYENLRGV